MEELARCAAFAVELERQRAGLAAAREELAGERRVWKAAAAALGAGEGPAAGGGGARGGDRRARQSALRIARGQLEARSYKLNSDMQEWNAAAAFCLAKREEAEHLLEVAEEGGPGWEGAAAALGARLLSRERLESRATPPAVDRR
jgi:hypothetical protein